MLDNLRQIERLFDLRTRIGAYLFRENHFRSNGLVGSMTLELLDGYFDASGKQASVKDKLITVNGCLSTPTNWQAFDIEWQKTLKDFGFTPDPKFGRFVFHTTDFHSGYCKLSPKAMSKADRQLIYRTLIQIVRRHSLFIGGFAVVLKDYVRFANKYPSITKICFGKPGTFVSILGFGRFMEWAGNKNYSKSISVMFDRGDEFWGEMSHGFEAFVKTPANEHLSIGSLTSGNKAEFSPLQAADIVAWESRQHFSNLAHIKVTVAGITPRHELEMLKRPNSQFDLYQYEEIERRVCQLFPSAKGKIVKVEQDLKLALDELDNKQRLKKERRDARKKAKNTA